MDLSEPTTRFVDTPTRSRLAGPDVVRAVALIGVVVMNYNGYLIIAGDGEVGQGWAAELFDPWNGPLSTRFAATFVLVAGVGVTLLTRRSIGDHARVTEMRWRLARRGVLLYAVGLVLDEIWPGTIIIYYGVMFVLAALIFTWRTRWVVAAGAFAALAGAVIRAWRFERDRGGHSTEWLTSPGNDSVRRFVFDVFVNGTHPLLPWFAFLCAGIVLGRVLTTTWWRPAAIGGGLVLVAASRAAPAFADSGLGDLIASTDPYDRGIAYVASALGTALVAYALIDWLAQRFPLATDPLRRAGQLTLSLYLIHIVVFNVFVDWCGWVRPTGLDTALVFAAVFWIAAITSAMVWQRRFARGPAEYVYRAFGG